MNNQHFRFKPNILLGLLTGSMMMGASSSHAEEKSYTKVPFSAYSSQMSDALLGNDKYEKPVWNLHDTLKLPNWLSLGIDQRTRYETMDGAFAKGVVGGDQGIVFQTAVFAEARYNQWRLAGEFMDSRRLGADTGSSYSLSNSKSVDQVSLLQSYLAWSDQNIFNSGLGVETVVGRQTMNFGSTRLIARNVYGNTTTSFDGLRLRVLDYDNWQLNAFVTMPVVINPSKPTVSAPTAPAANASAKTKATYAASLASYNNSINAYNSTYQFDTPTTHNWFSGVFLEGFNLFAKTNGELYFYMLNENNTPLIKTTHRHYYTPGIRAYRKPAKGDFDYQVEVIGQFGTLTNAANQKMSHTAWYQHIDAGYTFNLPWNPRLSLEYDYASGNRSNTGNKDQRFDALYGTTRFDYGPGGIYSAFARTNLNTPGYRISANPVQAVQLGLAHRYFWLAQKTDSWGNTGLQDTTGKSGRFIGSQLELTARWDLNSSLNFETGWTHLFKGEFAKSALAGAPQGVNAQDVDYFYVQSMLRF